MAEMREIGVQTNRVTETREELGKRMKVADFRPKAASKSYAEVLKQPLLMEDETFVEVKEECAKILGHLKLCLVGRWTLLEP